MATWWGKFTFLSMHNTCQLACKKTLPCFYQLLYFFQWCCSWQLLWTNRCPSSYVTWLDELLICESKRWGKGWERSVGLSGQSCPPDLEAEACFQLFQFDRNASLQCVCFLDWPTAVTRLWIRGGGLRLRCSSHLNSSGRQCVWYKRCSTWLLLNSFPYEIDLNPFHKNRSLESELSHAHTKMREDILLTKKKCILWLYGVFWLSSN